MPEHIRSLVVVLAIATIVFAALRRSLGHLMPARAYQRRRNAFLALTACAFLAPGFWFYALPAAVIVLITARREENVPALFLALLFAVPPAAAPIPGLGLVNFLLQVDHPRLLSLLLLLPLAIALRRKPSAPGTPWPDRLFFAYLLLTAALVLARSASLTNGARGVVYLLIDAFLPYYVMSRALADTEKLKDALAAFCVSGAVLAAIGIFEALKHWLLYRALLDHWSADFGMGNYLLREGVLRAVTTTGQPIVLGYVLMVALGSLLALRSQLRPGLRTTLLFALLLGGLAATLSRGPWLGAAATVFAFWATANASRMRMGLAIAAVAGLALLLDMQLPSLSLVRDVDASTVEYRYELLSKSMQVIGEHPWLGSDQYVQRLAANGMLQGEGIVDIVNTYLGVALATGWIGLLLFVALFAVVLLGLLKAKGRYQAAEARAAGTPQAARVPAFGPSLAARALLACVLGIAVTIGTVSSISVIPWVYWAWMGAAVGLMRGAVRSSSEPAAPRLADTSPASLSPIGGEPAGLS